MHHKRHEHFAALVWRAFAKELTDPDLVDQTVKRIKTLVAELQHCFETGAKPSAELSKVFGYRAKRSLLDAIDAAKAMRAASKKGPH